jgi:hypothetical protein
VSLTEQPVERRTYARVLVVLGALVAVVVGTVALIRASWRAIILAFILVFTIWLAFQVSLHTINAYEYLRNAIPKWLEQAEWRVPLHIPLVAIPSVPHPAICWRDRSVVAGDCFKPTEQTSSPPARPLPGRPLPSRGQSPPPCCRFQDSTPVDRGGMFVPRRADRNDSRSFNRDPRDFTSAGCPSDGDW